MVLSILSRLEGKKRKNQDLDSKGHTMGERRLMQPLHMTRIHHSLTLKGVGSMNCRKLLLWGEGTFIPYSFCFYVEGLCLDEHCLLPLLTLPPGEGEMKYLNGEFQKCTSYLSMLHGTHSSWDVPGSWESVLCAAPSVHWEVCSHGGSPGLTSLPVLGVGAKFNYRIKD